MGVGAPRSNRTNRMHPGFKTFSKFFSAANSKRKPAISNRLAMFGEKKSLRQWSEGKTTTWKRHVQARHGMQRKWCFQFERTGSSFVDQNTPVTRGCGYKFAATDLCSWPICTQGTTFGMENLMVARLRTPMQTQQRSRSETRVQRESFALSATDNRFLSPEQPSSTGKLHSHPNHRDVWTWHSINCKKRAIC